MHEIPRESLAAPHLEFAHSFGMRAMRRLMPNRAGAGSLLFRDTVLLDEVKECVHSIPLLRDIVDVKRCNELLARTRAGTCPSEEMLGALTSLCMSAATLRMWAVGLIARAGGVMGNERRRRALTPDVWNLRHTCP